MKIAIFITKPRSERIHSHWTRYTVERLVYEIAHLHSYASRAAQGKEVNIKPERQARQLRTFIPHTSHSRCKEI